MPRKVSALNESIEPATAVAATVRRDETAMSVDEKLDQIAEYLRQINNRDRLRTIGSSIRGALALIPLLIFLWSVWYFYLHGTEIIKMITDESVKSAATYSQQGLMDQMTQYLQQQKK